MNKYQSGFHETANYIGFHITQHQKKYLAKDDCFMHYSRHSKELLFYYSII